MALKIDGLSIFNTTVEKTPADQVVLLLLFLLLILLLLKQIISSSLSLNELCHGGVVVIYWLSFFLSLASSICVYSNLTNSTPPQPPLSSYIMYGSTYAHPVSLSHIYFLLKAFLPHLTQHLHVFSS